MALTRLSRNASWTLRNHCTQPTGPSECAHTAPPGTAETPQGDIPTGDSGPLRPAPLLISAGAASTQRRRHPAITRIAHFHLTPRPWSTIPSPPSGSHRAPSSLPDLLLPSQSTSGMAVGGAFPELSPGFSGSWLSPLCLCFRSRPHWLPAFSAHPLVPTSGLHSLTAEQPPEDTRVAPAPPPLPMAPPQAWLLLSFTRGAELPPTSHIHPHKSRVSPHLNQARAREPGI